jgi:hypothetical protein
VSDQSEINIDAESALDEQEARDIDIDVDESQFSDEHLSQLVEREAEWEKSLELDSPAGDDVDLPLAEEESPSSNTEDIPTDKSPARFALSQLA